MAHRIFNASNVFGTIAFFAMLAALGTWEAAIEDKGPYMVPLLLTVAFGACAYLSIREGGKKR